MPAKRSPTPGYGEGREALLSAAVTVVARGGLRALTYRAVAEQAGVTHGLVRHHFGSRDALIVAATEYSLNPSLVASEVTGSSGPLAAFAAGIPRMISDEGDLLAFQYEVILESRRRPELRGAVHALLHGLRRGILEDLRTHGIEATPALGALVMSALDGIVLHGLMLDEPDQVQRSLEELRTLLRPLSTPDSQNS